MKLFRVPAILAALLLWLPACDQAPANASRSFWPAFRARVYRVFARQRHRGPDPPRVGTDAIPGLDARHPRPAPPELPDVTPGELVLVPAGPFWMGDDTVPDERPRHRETTAAYRIEKTEVSTGRFRAFVASGGYDDPAFWTAAGWAWKQATHAQPVLEGRPDALPMVNVSFYEAQAYARWAGRRLPTEVEWEKAARGTDGRTFPWGDEHDPTRSNHWLYKLAPPTFQDLSWPVASWRQGQSPYGALHMAGNVWEWTTSPYSGTGYTGKNEASSGQDNRSAEVPPGGGDPRDPGGGPRPATWLSIRGGSWTNLLSYQRTSAREPAQPGERRPTLGFRCVAGVDTEEANP